MDDNESPFTLTPDGAWILLGAGANSGPSVPATTRLMRLPTQGGTPEQVMEWPTQGDLAGIDCPTHSGTACLISRWTEGKLTFYVLDPVHGQGKAVAETRLRKSDDLVHALSQDGTHIALTSKGQLPGKVRIWDVKTGSEREIDLPNEWNIYGGAGGVAGQYCWSADGKAPFLMGRLAEPPKQYFLGRLSLDGKSQVFLKQAKSMWNLLASPDGQRLAFAQLTNESNAWMLENF